MKGGDVRLLNWIFVATLAWMTLSCSEADTLADEPPREVVISGAPSYVNGVGELLSLKCGYCHAVPPTDITPDNIAPNIDLNSYETRLNGETVVRGADSIGRWIEEGLLEHAVAVFEGSSDPRRMPLDYATQLTDSEKQALHQWSDAGSPRGDEGEPPNGNAEAGEDIYDRCDDCHGDEGEGIPSEAGRYYGPQIRRTAVTVAKLKSMWLHRAGRGEPLSDSDAADLRAYMLTLSELAD